MDPSHFRFTETHEWVHVKSDTLVVGVTEYAAALLADVTNVELPEPDDHHYEEHEDIGTIEGIRSSMDFHAPLTGVIVATNTRLLSNPELINSDPFGEGWIVELKPDRMADIDELLDVDEYEAGIPEFEE